MEGIGIMAVNGLMVMVIMAIGIIMVVGIIMDGIMGIMGMDIGEAQAIIMVMDPTIMVQTIMGPRIMADNGPIITTNMAIFTITGSHKIARDY